MRDYELYRVIRTNLLDIYGWNSFWYLSDVEFALKSLINFLKSVGQAEHYLPIANRQINVALSGIVELLAHKFAQTPTDDTGLREQLLSLVEGILQQKEYFESQTR